MTRRYEVSWVEMAASHSLPQAAGFASNVPLDVGIEQWKCEVSIPSLALPLQGGGDIWPNGLFGLDPDFENRIHCTFTFCRG
ncbi:MAG: hypothetical protein A3J24_01170 [Deltaproteobacteria bacterium RIFCSPLOWO2_02_FULL_53_8]|nr:MAG: hypothetical protein A3J24_01170 [Deltaproteobacteria bacterium RIFCSPLOWO2_02_FULL_53_8]